MAKNDFQSVYEINVNHKTKEKSGLKYLSWAWAWAEFKKIYADATYSVDLYNGKPYLSDDVLGYMVSTTVTVGELTIPMHLPVLDGANKAMKSKKYEYEVKEWVNRKWTGKYIGKPVQPASMFDINTAIMRCLTKNLAMFGLGLYIYAGEDIPSVDNTETLSDEQVKTIKGMLSELIPEGVVCGVVNVNKIEEILASDFDACVNWIKGQS